MLNKLLEIIGGKAPDIFDKEGKVRHNLSKKRWERWQKRYTESEEYNWKNHTGMKASGK